MRLIWRKLTLSICSIWMALALLTPIKAEPSFSEWAMQQFKNSMEDDFMNLHFSLKNPSKYGIKAKEISLGKAPSKEEYEKGLAENADKQEIIERLKPYFRPEFLNRFNAVIEFSHLNKKDLSQIVDLMLIEVNKTLSKKEIDLAVSDAAKEFLTEEGYDEVMGVRPLRRVIEQQIRDNVTDFHLENLDAKHLVADLEDGILVIKEKSETDKKTEEKKSV